VRRNKRRPTTKRSADALKHCNNHALPARGALRRDTA